MSMKAVTHLANNLLQLSLIIISFTGGSYSIGGLLHKHRTTRGQGEIAYNTQCHLPISRQADTTRR